MDQKFKDFFQDNPEEALKLLKQIKENVVVPHPGQRLILDSPARYKVVNAGRRYGKAAWVEEKILTPSGWRRYGDIKPGDEAIGVNGQPTKVLNTYPQGVKSSYKVSFSDGTSLLVCGEHLWEVGSKRGKEVLDTKRIAQDYIIKRSDGRTEHRYSVPLTKPVEYTSNQELPLHPWVVGALLGDGGLGRGVYFSTSDSDMLEAMATLLPAGSKIKHYGKYDYGISGIIDQLRQLGMIGKRSWEKSIPREYLLASPKDRMELLRGLMDTDGNIAVGKAEFSSCSKQLSEDVAELARSLGGKAKLFSKKTVLNGVQHRDAFVLHIHMTECPFWLKRKASRWKPSRMTKKIVDISPADPVKMLCIEVEAEDGLYVMTDYIVTHNTKIAAKILIDETRKAPPGAVTFWVAPTYKVVKRGYREVLRQLPDNFIIGIPPSDSAFDSGRSVILRFKNGAQMEFYSAERPGGMLGEGVRFVVLDEAATMPSAVWEQIVRPMLMDTKGGALLISTPRGRNWFYKRYQMGQDPQQSDWASWTFTSYDNPHVEDEEVKQMEEELPTVLFQQEALAMFIADGSAVFQWDAKYLQHDQILDNGMIEDCSPKGHVFLGIDLAKTGDFTVLYGAREADRKNVYYERFHDVRWKEQKRRIRRAVAKLMAAGAEAVTLMMDSTGVGDPIVEDMEEAGFDVVGLNFTTWKSKMVVQLANDLERGRAILLDDALISEFEDYQMSQTSKLGKISYSAPEGSHDDVVSAKMLSHWGMVNEGAPSVASISGNDAANEAETNPWDDDIEDEDSDWADLVDEDEIEEDAMSAIGLGPARPATLAEAMNNPSLWR